MARSVFLDDKFLDQLPACSQQSTWIQLFCRTLTAVPSWRFDQAHGVDIEMSITGLRHTCSPTSNGQEDESSLASPWRWLWPFTHWALSPRLGLSWSICHRVCCGFLWGLPRLQRPQVSQLLPPCLLKRSLCHRRLPRIWLCLLSMAIPTLCPFLILSQLYGQSMSKWKHSGKAFDGKPRSNYAILSLQVCSQEQSPSTDFELTP